MSRKKLYVWAGALRITAVFLVVLATLPLSILVAPNAVEASIFNVNSTDDAVDANPGDGVCETAPGNGVCTLRAAIQEANAQAGDHMINLPAGTYLLTIPGRDEDLAATGDLDITQSLTISGAGAETTIIDGNGLDRIFHIIGGSDPFLLPNVTVTIIGVTLRNGQVPETGFGGAILTVEDSTLALIASVVTGNSAILGGGIATFGFPSFGRPRAGELSLTNSTVSGNTAGQGGGILARALLTLTNTTVSGNTATNVGGGISHFVPFAAGTAALITNSTISGNMVMAGGGGGMFEIGGNATLLNSTISGNMGGAGGGISLGGGTVNLNNVTITNNTAAIIGGGITTSDPAFPIFNFRNTIIGGNVSPSAPDCASSSLTSQGFNLIQDTTGCTIIGDTTGNITGADPMLGALADNGGLTQTHALLLGSPAIDAGNPAAPGSGANACEATDQRGAPRLAPCDMGAFEFGATPPTGPAGRAYVRNRGGVSVINTATNTVVGAVGMAAGDTYVALSPDGARLYNSIFVINTATLAIVAEVSLIGAPIGRPIKAGPVSPDGTRLYMLAICDECPDDTHGAVLVVDTATNTLATTILLEAHSIPFDVAVSPDGTRLYVLNNRLVGTALIDVIDTATNTLLVSQPLGASGPGQQLAVSRDGTRLYVTVVDPDSVKVMETATNSVIATVPVGQFPQGVAVRPDDAFAYVANSTVNSVSVIDTAANSVVATVPVGARPFGVAVSPDGSRVYVTTRDPLTDKGTVKVIDTATNSVVATVPVGLFPGGVAVAPAVAPAP